VARMLPVVDARARLLVPGLRACEGEGRALCLGRVRMGEVERVESSRLLVRERENAVLVEVDELVPCRLEGCTPLEDP
jgi:hypothetical protein